MAKKLELELKRDSCDEYLYLYIEKELLESLSSLRKIFLGVTLTIFILTVTVGILYSPDH